MFSLLVKNTTTFLLVVSFTGKKVKIKVAILDIALLARLRDQKRFTISEVAADWHELFY